MIVVRENTEDAYAGMWGQFKKGTADEVATQEIIFTPGASSACCATPSRSAARATTAKVHAAHEGERRPRDGALDDATFAEVGARYPDIQREHWYIDAPACMFVVTAPEQYDTVVTSNMFGDIFTDRAPRWSAGSSRREANLHPGRVSLFEEHPARRRNSPARTGRTFSPRSWRWR